MVQLIYMHVYMYIGIGDAKKELRRDYRAHKINTLCTRKESNIIDVKVFITASALQSFAWKFDVMTTKCNSSIFNSAWDAAMCRAQQNNPSMSITDVEAQVWMPAFTHCQQLLNRLHSQVMTLADVEQYFKDYDKRRLQRELDVLFRGVNQCLQKTYDGSWICLAVCRIEDYRNLHNYCYAADCFLRLRDSLKLTKGDFKDVERISKEVI